MNLFSRPAAVLCLAATATILLPALLPLGIPGEWTWQRHAWPLLEQDYADPLLLLAERLLPALVSGGLLLLLWFYAERWLGNGRTTTTRVVGCYGLLLCCGWGWLQSVQATAPLTHRNLKPLWVLYDPGASGYFFTAAHQMDDVQHFLATYEDRMSEGEVLHVGTHPPGLFLMSRATIEACQRSNLLRRVVRWCGSSAQRDAFRTIESDAGFSKTLTETELDALQLLSLSTSASAVAVLLPFGLLVNRLCGLIIAWRLCCLWLTVPAIAIFLPKSDVLFAFSVTSVLALAVTANTSAGRSRIVLAVAAGSVCWVGLLLSLAHLTVLIALAGYSALLWLFQRRTGRTAVQTMAVLLTTIVALTVIWNLITDCNLWRVWSWNLSNHSGFYEQYTRTAWKWLLSNPLELSLAVGLPLMWVAVRGVYAAARRFRLPSEDRARHQTTLCLALAATWTLLWLSGKNQGEAARLWCFLTPWVVLWAGLQIEVGDPNETRQAASRTAFRRLLLCQMIVAVLTVGRVSGFSF